jgi:hypothetical protein
VVGFSAADELVVVVGFAVDVIVPLLLLQPAASARTSTTASEIAIICFFIFRFSPLVSSVIDMS